MTIASCVLILGLLAGCPAKKDDGKPTLEGSSSAPGKAGDGMRGSRKAQAFALEAGVIQARCTGIDEAACANVRTGFETACAAGDHSGCTHLALMLVNGKGGVADVERAMELTSRACTSGHAAGCLHLGSLHEEGVLGMPDRAAAIVAYRAACDRNYPPGCHNLGGILRSGSPEEKTEAVGHMTKACDAGFANGCVNRGLAFAMGDGVAKDETQARTIYQRACELGAAQGCANLGVLWQSGLGGTRDQDKARRLFFDACSDADFDSKHLSLCQDVRRDSQ